jgi:hypothetical protein
VHENDIQLGYVYHISTLYFDNMNDPYLMKNHEGNATRPTYFCLKDKATKLFIPVRLSI